MYKLRNFFYPTVGKIILTVLIGIIGFVILFVVGFDVLGKEPPTYVTYLTYIYTGPFQIALEKIVTAIGLRGRVANSLFPVFGGIWWYIIACTILHFRHPKKISKL